MQDTIDLKSPHRPIRVGVILLGSSVLSHANSPLRVNHSHSETELLDVALSHRHIHEHIQETHAPVPP
jgi:hypothetical protein